MNKGNKQPSIISPKFDRWILLFTIVSAVVVIIFITTDHLPAWTPAWGTIFETANNFAISFLVTAIFYFFTVYRPEKKKYEYTSRYLQIDKRRLDAEIERYSFFLVAHANRRLPADQIDLANITQYSIKQAFDVFCNIDKDDEVWDNLARYINEMILQLEIFTEKYSEYLSDEMFECIRDLEESVTFSNIRNISNWKDLIREKTIFIHYYPLAVKFVSCKNLMKERVK